MDRFVLCRPQGGLNDMLVQIEKCCRYADAARRRVIVDTDYRNTTHFRSPLSHYFVSRHRDLILDNPFSDAELDSFEVFPPELAGRVSSYAPRWRNDTKLHHDTRSGVSLTFDFQKKYSQQVLLHQQAGGGTLAPFALMRLRLHDALNDQLVLRLRSLPASYAALHIRHTDYMSHYRSLLSKLRGMRLSDVFVATDNVDVLGEVREELSGTKVHSFSVLPDNGGKPLHVMPDRSTAGSLNRDAILDLLTLSLARRLFVAPLSNNDRKPLSGYSRLAVTLASNRQVLRQIIERADVLELMERR